MEKLIRFFKDEEGATAVEYGIMVAAIAAVIVTVVFAIGTKVNRAFENVNRALSYKTNLVILKMLGRFSSPASLIRTYPKILY